MAGHGASVVDGACAACASGQCPQARASSPPPLLVGAVAGVSGGAVGLAAGLARLTADGLRVGKAAKNAARGVRRTAVRDVLRPARQLGALAGAYVQRTAHATQPPPHGSRRPPRPPPAPTRSYAATLGFVRDARGGADDALSHAAAGAAAGVAFALTDAALANTPPNLAGSALACAAIAGGLRRLRGPPARAHGAPHPP